MNIPEFEHFDQWVNILANYKSSLSKATIDRFIDFLEERIAIVSEQKLEVIYNPETKGEREKAWNNLKETIIQEIASDPGKVTKIKNEMNLTISNVFKESVSSKIERYRSAKRTFDEHQREAQEIQEGVNASSQPPSQPKKIQSILNKTDVPKNREKKSVTFGAPQTKEFVKSTEETSLVIKKTENLYSPLQDELRLELKRQLINIEGFEKFMKMDGDAFVDELAKHFGSEDFETEAEGLILEMVSEKRDELNDYYSNDAQKERKVKGQLGSFEANLMRIFNKARNVIQDKELID